MEKDIAEVFTPTVDELELLKVSADVRLDDEQLGQLARSYSEEIYDICFWTEAYGQTGSAEGRRILFAKARLNAIERAMGPDHFARATEDIRRKWDRFSYDTLNVHLAYLADIMEGNKLADELAVLDLVADRLLARHQRHGALHAECDWEDFNVAFKEATDRLLDEAGTLMRTGGDTSAGQLKDHGGKDGD